jgi:hypothetical protein
MIKSRGNSEVYQCSVCNRKKRVQKNYVGLDVICHCTITANCPGKLSRITNQLEISNTPDTAPELSGISDWFQRKVLYNYDQTYPAIEWVINHKLGVNPIFKVIVDIGNGTQQIMKPNRVETIDANTTKLIFLKEYSGTAQAISMESQVTTTTPSVQTTSSNYTQISTNSGFVNVATLKRDLTVAIDTHWNTIGVDKLLEVPYLNIGIGGTVESIWADTNDVFINGKIYAVRTLDIIGDSNSNQYFNIGVIRSGTPMTFSMIDTDTIEPNQVLILLGNYPFSSYDKNFTQYIDIGNYRNIDDLNFVYKNGTIQAKTSTIKDIYPYIKVV